MAGPNGPTHHDEAALVPRRARAKLPFGHRHPLRKVEAALRAAYPDREPSLDFPDWMTAVIRAAGLPSRALPSENDNVPASEEVAAPPRLPRRAHALDLDSNC